MLNDLESAINRLQHAYFNEISSSLKTAAIDSETPFFFDPKLANHFQETCNKLGVTEYYYLSNPSRFTLRTQVKTSYCCVIYTEDDLVEHLQILQEEGAPIDLCSAIESRNFVPLFNTEDGYYEPRMDNAIGQIHPATRVSGKVSYYLTVIEDKVVAEEQNLNPSSLKLH